MGQIGRFEVTRTDGHVPRHQPRMGLCGRFATSDKGSCRGIPANLPSKLSQLGGKVWFVRRYFAAGQILCAALCGLPFDGQIISAE